VAKADWNAVEALVKPVFDAGHAPERSDLIDIAYAQNADDDIVDAFDTLGSKPIPSLEALREQLQANGALQ
jgi:hypothetical protein